MTVCGQFESRYNIMKIPIWAYKIFLMIISYGVGFDLIKKNA